MPGESTISQAIYWRKNKSTMGEMASDAGEGRILIWLVKIRKLLKLAGYLKGKAQLEWNLLEMSSKQSFDAELGNRLNLDGKAVAAQNYQYLVQHNRG